MTRAVQEPPPAGIPPSAHTCASPSGQMGAAMERSLRIGIIQMVVGGEKAANVARAVAKIGEAAAQGAKLVVLPVRQRRL